MIQKPAFFLFSLFVCSAAFAGTEITGNDVTGETLVPPVDRSPSGFDRAIRPITNPTQFDLALPRTQIHGIYMHQNLPDNLAIAGGSVPAGGDFNVYALQLEYAISERFSLIALKDGYIDFNPEGSVLSSDEGFANVAAGVKYAFLYQPEYQHVLSGTATVEFPIGDSEVWQGEGDGALNLSLTDLKLWNRWQFAGAIGTHIPFDGDAESLTGFMSGHVSYEISSWFQPLVEVNWYHVFDEGDGGRRFTSQAGGAVPSLVAFEGGDLINFGASNSGVNEDIVTLGVGFRSQVTDNLSLGFAYEIPLTDEEENLMDDRFTIDFGWKF